MSIKNIKEQMLELDRKYEGKDDILGKNVLTMANRTNSSRAIMVSSQLDQNLVLLYPEIPKMFTNYEDIVGEFSSAYYRAEADLIVVGKIQKFEDNPDHLYTLIVFNPHTQQFDVIEKKSNERLTESYGYKYNTQRLDSKEINDTIETGEVLYSSTSFDENMNYRYGLNVNCMYAIDNRTIEDAIRISTSFAERLKSIEVENVRISLNDNDLLINMYGGEDGYRAFPDIGEKINKDTILACKRRITYSQSLYDLKYENMQKPNFRNDTTFYAEGTVVDVNIYCNKPYDEIPKAKYNKQIMKYYDNELRYHKEIVEKLGEIMKSGNYSEDLDFMYKRSKDILDPTCSWKDGNNSTFSNMIIEFVIEKESGVTIGQKLTGRFGDKGVISEIVPDDEMPYTETGLRVDAIFNVLGVVNRLNPGQLYEVELNFIGHRVRERLAEMTTLAEKENLLFGVIHDVNATQGKALVNYYTPLSEDEKLAFFEDVDKNGIMFHQPPMYDNMTLDKFEFIYDKYGFEPYTCYINKFGRKIKMLNPVVVGSKYILKLKHTPKGKFSTRSTGYSNSKDLPSKSIANKHHRSIYQKTPVRVGEMEYSNLLMTQRPELLAYMSMLYSTSVMGRRDTGQLYENNVLELEDIKMSDHAKNRAAEIATVYLKSIGIGLEFEIEDGEEENVADILDGVVFEDEDEE